MPYHADPHGKAPGLSGGRGSEGECGQRLYCDFHGMEWVKQGKQVWD